MPNFRMLFFFLSLTKNKKLRKKKMEEYLTVKELSDRIKFSKQTLYNFIHKRTFDLNKHYVKPTPKKILFKWSEIKKWMEQSAEIENNDIDPKYLSENTIHSDTISDQKPSSKSPTGQTTNATPKSRINI
jgi:predicted DNA-binding transcriptional regulator AlpA